MTEPLRGTPTVLVLNLPQKKVSQMTDSQIIEVQAQIANSIAKKLNENRKATTVTNAIELLMIRIVAAGNSLRVLQEHAPHDVAFDGAMILRGIYDSMLQALYILNDPPCQEARAALYLEYRWIEKRKRIELFDSNSTTLAQRLSQSPLRQSTEPAIDREFQRVRGNYENSKQRLRNHWYEGSLRDLATTTGFESEYEVLQQLLSGAVHASSLALQEGPNFEGFLVMDFAWRFSLRVLGKFAEYANIKLDDVETTLIRSASENVLNFEPTA